jgi:hypothetical protein
MKLDKYSALYRPLIPGKQVRLHALGTVGVMFGRAIPGANGGAKSEPIVTVVRPLCDGDFTGGACWQVRHDDGTPEGTLREYARAHLSRKIVKETFTRKPQSVAS